MKSPADIILPDDRRYTDEHVWVKADGNELVAGISDFAQDQLGEVVFVSLPRVGIHSIANKGFGNVESLKADNALFMPVAGEITAVNSDLANTPELVNESCYEKAWMIRIKPDNMADCDALMTAGAYRAFLDK